ncbi:MAG: ABC transporter permease subunit [Bacillus sp. (in: Bacteria)]|nr:ABC transporter permease subunit [Bacillus sp. (in: firmicutes)]
MRIHYTKKLVTHEFQDFLKQPSLWMLVVLPVFMSIMVIGLMNEPGVEMMLLPSWIIFAQVMVGLMIIAPGFIEEKEQKTLDALLVSPLTLGEVIIAKCSVIFLFSVLSQVFVYVLNMGVSFDIIKLLPFMVAGGILFIQVGLVIGMILDSSKSSAAVSSIVMVVLFVTASFYEQLPEWKTLLQFLPSVAIVENMHGVLGGQLDWVPLVIAGAWLVIMTGLIVFLVKRELNK